ncbi:uncharacterized protein LOC126109610 isoform X2 [Schistocerca cancellata]|nr:uncharacterized protein LOC126109610 isoform X2 [Schistocerca cancellata]XP_049770612.1 uncharacterized protein LOC126109610 isoform X2 [Schistocerca cancellata]
MTAPSPAPSNTKRSEDRFVIEMAAESVHSEECHMAGEDIAVCWSSAPSEAPQSTVTSAAGSANSVHCESGVSAVSLHPQQSEIAFSDLAGSIVDNMGTWRVSIDDLPDEVLIKIFSHLSFTELVYVVQKVCPRWKNVSQDSELWADKEYRIGSHTSDQEAIQTFCDAPNLQKVCMLRSASSLLFRALYDKCHRLLELRLDYTQKLSYSVLKNLVEKCSRIHTLGISSRLLVSEKFSEAVSHMQNLHVLILEGYSTESPPALRPLADGCPQLAEVDFGFTAVDMYDLKYFLNAKRNTLKSLHIKWTMVVERRDRFPRAPVLSLYWFVLPLLTVCADSLECLELYEYCILGNDSREAFTALGSLKNLQELRMPILKLVQPGAAASAFKTGGLTKLRLLDLRGAFYLDNETLIAISHGCPALRELIVRNVLQLSDAAFSQIYHLENLDILDVSGCIGLGRAFVPCLIGLPRLRTLVMEQLDFRKLRPGLSSILELSSVRCLIFSYSLITGVPFAKFPRKLASLRKLIIKGCRGDPKVVDGLSEQMPTLEVHGTIEEEEPVYNVEDYESDEELAKEENAGHGDVGEARNDSFESDEDGDGYSTSTSISSSDNE